MMKMIYRKVLYVMSECRAGLLGLAWLYLLLINLAMILCGLAAGIGFAVTLLLSAAVTMIFLRAFRGEPTDPLQLFDCFRDRKTAKHVLIGMAWRELWIFIWALIPVAGIYFALCRCYEYRLVPYILMEEPDIAPTDALAVSKERTQGYKTMMFCADFLAILITAIVALLMLILSRVPVVGAVLAIIMLAFLAVLAAALPVILGLLRAAFYEEIMNPTVEEEPEEAAEGTVCPVCGVLNPENSRFCCSCGARVGEDSEAVADTEENL